MTGWFAIVNPNAGFGTARKRFEALRGDLSGQVSDAVFTLRPGHATELANAAYTRGVRRFLSVGGDGTTFEVVNGLMQVAREPFDLAVLPLGTGNSFMRDFGVSSQRDAIAALSASEPKLFWSDVLRLKHRDGVLFSFNQLGVGFVADAGATTNAKYKKLGALGYVAAVLEETVKLAPAPVRYALDDGSMAEEPLTLLAICNSRCTGGTMKMAPAARVDDGLLDVVAIRPLSRVRLLTSFPRIFLGTHVTQAEVSAQTARRVCLDSGTARPTIIDGEVFDIALEEVEVVPRAMRVLGISYPPRA